MIRYCLPDVAKGLFNGMIGNYLLYFFQPTTLSGLPSLLPQNKLLGFITIMALLTGIGKVIDAVSDPWVANLSDRCTHRDGRRVPFMKFSAIPYALSAFLIFMPPFAEGSAWNAVWVCIFILAYYLAYTFYFIPRNALIPEIIPDAKDRVTYYGISTALFMGSSSFMYAATLFVSLFKQLGINALWSWRIVFAIFSAIGLVCVVLGATAIKEKEYVDGSIKPAESLVASIKTIFSNKTFVRFFAGDLFSYLSLAFFETAMLYYITMLLNIPEEQSYLVMLVAIAAALCLFPLIIKLCKKHGKKTMLVIASIVFTVVFAFIFFGDKISALVPGYELYLGLVMGLVVAFPFAAINILPQSVMSDIIQQDSIEHGVNREGFFSASKTFIEKIAYSIAMVTVSSVLAVGAADGESVSMLGVKLTGIFAGVLSLISLIFFILYDEKSVANAIAKYNENKEESIDDQLECEEIVFNHEEREETV